MKISDNVLVSKDSDIRNFEGFDLYRKSVRKDQTKNSLHPDRHFAKGEIPNISCPKFLCNYMEKWANRTFVRDGSNGQSLTYRQCLNRSRAAIGYFKKEIRPGEVVCIYARNKPDYVTAFVGISGASATVCHVNPEYTQGELEHTVVSVKAVCILSDLDNLSNALKVAKKCLTIRLVIVFGQTETESEIKVTSFDEVAASEPCDPNDDYDPKKQVLHILTSSGTTGMPKMVSLSHYSRVANTKQLGCADYRVMDPNVNDVLLLCVPMHLMFATVMWNHALVEGATVVTLPYFKPELFLKTIQDYKCTVVCVVPSLALFLSQSPIVDRFDLSSLKKMVTGGAPIASSVAEQVVQRLNLHSFRAGYGMTECGHLTFVRHSRTNYRSMGYPLPGTEFEVRDLATGAVLGPNEAGEFYIRGPQLMLGYLGLKSIFDDKGWLRTGDVGYYDETGEFYFVERIKDMLKVKGHQVAPAELESILLEHPLVWDVGVAGLPDIWAGELPLAFVVLAGEVQGLKDKDEWPKKAEEIKNDIKKYIAERTCRIKHLAGGVRFCESIPRTVSGKILRRQLKLLVAERE